MKHPLPIRLLRCNAWLDHPFRFWHWRRRPRLMRREANMVCWTEDPFLSASNDPPITGWIAKNLPYCFVFEEEDYDPSEIKEFMDDRARDAWTMGFFQGQFDGWYVFVRDEEDAFEARMRFKARYAMTIKEDKNIELINTMLSYMDTLFSGWKIKN